MTKKYLKKPAKRILYYLHKHTNINPKDACFGRYDRIRRSREILQKLKEKGLIFQNKAPRREKDDLFSSAVYWLTPEGIKVADEIAKEIDEYKRW